MPPKQLTIIDGTEAQRAFPTQPYRDCATGSGRTSGGAIVPFSRVARGDVVKCQARRGSAACADQPWSFLQPASNASQERIMRLYRILTRAIATVVSVSGVVGCSGTPEGSSAAHPTAGSTLLSQTVVRLQKDGKPIITRLPNATAKRATEESGLKALDCPPGACGETIDPGCAEADLWLFDEPNYSGNELCVISNGGSFLDLGDVTRSCFDICPPNRGCEQLCSTWSASIQSWSSGPGGPNQDLAGCFYQVPWWLAQPGIQQCFAPWAFESTASSIVKAAVTLQY
jgi:hypothetical protein